MEWSLAGPLSELCPMTPFTNQGGRHQPEYFNHRTLWEYEFKIFSQAAKAIGSNSLMEWSLGGPLSELCPMATSANQSGRHQTAVLT